MPIFCWIAAAPNKSSPAPRSHPIGHRIPAARTGAVRAAQPGGCPLYLDHAARFEALRQRGSDYFGREEARFALQLQHDPRTALDMARRNWQVQRAPWDARVLLEAAKAANQPRAATEALEFLQQTGLEDPIVDPLAQEAAQPNGSPMASNHMRKTLLALCTLAVSAGAGAHSASDAYLNIVSDKSPSAAAAASSAATVLHGQWDIALRDLEFV